ncbi:MAG: transposase [SAR202 cluster bacterium]|nr:transposase [SAR202 cluster bacterium]
MGAGRTALVLDAPGQIGDFLSNPGGTEPGGVGSGVGPPGPARGRGGGSAAPAAEPRAAQILISDRYGAYMNWPAAEHQICLAHLRRDLPAQADARGPAAHCARWVLEELRQVFRL